MIWRGEYPVRTDEVNRQGILTLPALASYLQDAAAQHAQELGFSVEDLQQQGLTWVLSRLQLRIDSGARWGQRLQVETWPVGLERLFAYRDFRVSDCRGQPVALAASDWLMMHLESRRPARPPHSFRHLVREKPARILEKASPQAWTGFEPQGERRLTVRPSDLDFNEHVNHVRYLEWMLDALPQERLPNPPCEAVIEFRGEAVLGDEIVSRWACPGAAVLRHALVRKPDNRLLAAAEVRSTHSSN